MKDVKKTVDDDIIKCRACGKTLEEHPIVQGDGHSPCSVIQTRATVAPSLGEVLALVQTFADDLEAASCEDRDEDCFAGIGADPAACRSRERLVEAIRGRDAALLTEVERLRVQVATLTGIVERAALDAAEGEGRR